MDTWQTARASAIAIFVLLLPKLALTQTPSQTSKPNASQQFPYPGEKPEIPAAPDAPAKPAGKAVKDRFPYPGEEPEATDSSKPATDPAAGNGSSSSSSSATDAPTDAPSDPDAKPPLHDEGTTGTTARQRRRLRPPAQKILSDEERVQEDLDVAHFYQQSGNLNGAYLRAKDAVKLQPQTPEAHLALAGIAEKLQKREEAIAEYSRYLELDPDGEQVKSARKNLEKLKP